MATPKTWTATDVKPLRLYLNPVDVNGKILVQRDYEYVNGGGVPLPGFGTQVFSTNVTFATLPANIKSALQAIDTWIYNQILTNEGMT